MEAITGAEEEWIMDVKNWKHEHAKEADKLTKHGIIESVLTEFAHNMHFERDGLPEYGLQKIVSYVAQVVLAAAKGINPDMLCLSPEEAKTELIKWATAFEESGHKLVVVSHSLGNKPSHGDPGLN